MTSIEPRGIKLPESNRYNYHSHTQFCDGRATMDEMVAAAFDAGMEIWGFSPHSPINVESPCNMKKEDVEPYVMEADRLRNLYAGRMTVMTGMEVDFISADFGPHLDYFQNLPLDYRIGSVHFVPNQDGIPIDCDGRYERFARNLRQGYNNDLRYVVEKYYEQVLTMIERGGFEILGHFDKIAGNAAIADPDIENQEWYHALAEDVVRYAKDRNIIIEINTKSFLDKERFFPDIKLWSLLFNGVENKGSESKIESILNKSILVNSDAHFPEKVNLGREEAYSKIGSFHRILP